MVFTGLEALAGLLVQSLASEAGRTVHPAAQWVLSRLTTRARRRLACQRLQVVLLRARLRIDVLLHIHASRVHPLGIIPAVTGYSTAASALDRVVVDLSEAMDAWLVVEDIGHRASAPAPDKPC